MKKINHYAVVMVFAFVSVFSMMQGNDFVLNTPIAKPDNSTLTKTPLIEAAITPRPISSRNIEESRIPSKSRMVVKAVAEKAAAISNPIYGCMLYNSTWSSSTGDLTHTEYGMYQFTNKQSDGIAKLKEGPFANYGGVYVDGIFYGNYVDMLAYGTFVSHRLEAYDPETWTMTSYVDLPLNSNLGITIDMTYDMTTKTVYAITYTDDKDSDGRRIQQLATVNVKTGEFVLLGACGKLATLSCDGYGQLWAIDFSGYLHKVDKTNGSVGDALMKVSQYPLDISGNANPYIQSAEFDFESGKLYWAATTGYVDNALYAFGHLYEIDVNALTSDCLYQFEGDAEWSGLFIKNKMPAAPGRITDLHFAYTSEGAFDGTIQFHAPSTTYDGKELTGTMDLDIRVDGKTVETLNAVTAGTQVTSNNYSFTDYVTHSISVVPTNSIGDGPETFSTVYGGKDTPAAATNLVLSTNDAGESVLTWTAPTKGSHGGYLDPDQLNYTIVRWPDKVTVATGHKGTSFTETINKDKALYYYQLISYAGNQAGNYAVSNKLALGNPCSIPYSNSFDDSKCIDVWTIIDNNGDATGTFTSPSWKWDETYGAIMYYTDSINAADDWAITPPLDMNSSKVYRLSYVTSGETGDYAAKIRVTVGEAPTVAAQKTILRDDAFAQAVSAPVQFNKIFTVKSDKPQYIGFYDYSSAYTDLNYIYSVRVEAVGTMESPDSISQLTIKGAEKGAYRATLNFTAPSKTVGGNALTGNSTIYIARDGKSVGTVTGAAPGAATEWIDQNAAQGWNHYSITAGNSTGIGFAVEDSVFVGQDIPLAVSNVDAELQSSVNATITWDAPAGNVGANGYYVDPAKLRYAIYRCVGSACNLIASNVTGTKYYDTNINTSSDEQAYVYYLVSAVSAQGEGATYPSNYILSGKSLSLPYEETFNWGHVTRAVWLTTDIVYTLWQTERIGTSPSANSVEENEEGGMLSFMGRGTPYKGTARFLSPRFNLSEWDKPELSFYVYHVNADSVAKHDDRVIVEVRADHLPYTQVGEPVHLYGAATGWQKHTISLDEYKTYDRISVSFRGINENCNSNIHLDKIELTGTPYDYELQAVKLAGPETTKAGTAESYTVTVKNIGVKDNNFKIELYRDDELIARKTVDNLAASTTESYGFYYTAPLSDAGDMTHEMYAKIVAAQDQYEGNNTTDKIKQTVTTENLPYITDLKAVAEGSTSAHLSWSEPTLTPYGNVKTDGVEDYTAFAIDNIGKYTLYDGDKAVPCGIDDGNNGQIEWPNYKTNQAWIVFNPSSLSIGSAPIQPYEGNQCFVSFAALSASGNDDWLISPPLSRNAQTLSFYAKALTAFYAERFQVLASSTDTKPESFTVVSGKNYVAPTAAWQEYSYDLPEGTKYFAIRNCGYDAYALLVDNLTFEGEADVVDLLGFNIYRNNEKINSEPVGDIDFTDANLSDLSANGYTYRVSAVFEQGESMLSNLARVGYFVGVNSVDTNSDDLNVSGGIECINVKNAAGKAIEVFTVDGKLVKNEAGQDLMTMPVASGMYIVTVDGKATKVIVK